MALKDGYLRDKRELLRDVVTGIVEVPLKWLVIAVLFIVTELAWISLIIVRSGFGNLFRRSILFTIIFIAVIFYFLAILTLSLQGLIHFIQGLQRASEEGDEDVIQEPDNDD